MNSYMMIRSEEEAEHMMRLKGEVDVLDGKEWDGKGNVHVYYNAFLFVTRQSKIFYAYADTDFEKQKWLRAIQLAFATEIPKEARRRLVMAQSPTGTNVVVEIESSTSFCPTCNDDTTITRWKCASCNNKFCEKHCIEEIALPHLHFPFARRVCNGCFYSQVYVNFLKGLVDRLHAEICVYPKRLDVENVIEILTPSRPSHTDATNIALGMFKEGEITAEELEDLLSADRRYTDNTAQEPEIPLDIKILALHRQFRSKGFSVCAVLLLLHQHLHTNAMLFKPILQKVLQFSFTHINEVEFFWPQIVHGYLRLPMFAFDKLFWMEELIISICTRSIHLALLLMWQLQGALEDSLAPLCPKDTEDKYGRIIKLMVAIECNVVGLELRTVLRQPKTAHIGYPKATEDQLVLIQDLTNQLEYYQDNAQQSLSSNVKDALEEKQSPILPPPVPELVESENVSNFSTFQQQLQMETSMQNRRESTSTNSACNLNFIAEAHLEKDMCADFKEDTTTKTRSLSASEKNVLGKYFADERQFVTRITDIAEKLRFVNPLERKKELPGYLVDFDLPGMVYVPLVKVTDPFERIIRIPSLEATAFSTKARVPVLLIFEVIRGGPHGLMAPTSPNRNSTARGKLLFDADDEVGQMLTDETLNTLDVSTYNDDEVTDANSNVSLPKTIELEVNPLHSAKKEETYVLPLMDVSKMEPSAKAIVVERTSELEAAFGESWGARRERLRGLSPHGHLPGWDIVSMISKSNDDLRQEVFALQLIQKFRDIFKKAGLPLWLKVYRIIATSATTGLIETLVNAISLDGLKKRDGYESLAAHFEKSYGPVDSARFRKARQHLIHSMAAYSLVTYFLQIKDRVRGYGI